MTSLLTTEQTAKRLGITPGRVRQLARATGIGQRLGRDWLFSAEDVARLDARRTQPGPVPGTRRTSSPQPSDDGAA